MRKLSHILFLILAIGITGCGDENQATGHADQPIIIGEILPYSGAPFHAYAVRKGCQLAIQQINKNGGVLNRHITVLSRDSQADPAKGVQHFQEIVNNDRVMAIIGPNLSTVSLAVANNARQNPIAIFSLAFSDQLLSDTDHDPVFRIGPSSKFVAMALAEYISDRKIKNWASVAHNYDAGHALVRYFEQARTDDMPINWTSQQWPAFRKLNAGPTIEAIRQTDPDALYQALFGSDLINFHREALSRDFYKDRLVLAVDTGWDYVADAMGDDYPTGWVTSGYPTKKINTPWHDEFSAAFYDKFGESPQLNSLIAYLSVNFIADAIEAAGKADRQMVIRQLDGLSIDGPSGPVRIDSDTNQADLGIWIGQTVTENNRPTLNNLRYFQRKDLK